MIRSSEDSFQGVSENTGKAVAIHSVVASLLLAGFFISIIWNRSFFSNFFYPLVALSLWAIATHKVSFRLTRWEKMAIGVALLWVASNLISVLANGWHVGGGDYFLHRHIKMVLIIPVVLYFRSFPVSRRFVWILAVVLIAQSAVVAGLEMYDDSLFPAYQRASGFIVPGDFAVTTLCAMTLLLALTNFSHRRELLGFLLVMAAGLFALWMSAARGVWMVLPVLGYLLTLVYGGKKAKRNLLMTTVLLLVMAALSYQSPKVQQRIDNIRHEVSMFYEHIEAGDDMPYTPIGARLEMWRVGVEMAKQTPLLGAGLDGFQRLAPQYADKSDWPDWITQHAFPHNIYITTLVTRGVVGLVVLMVLFFFLGSIYSRALKSGDPWLSQLGLAGMMMVVVYMISGLTDDLIDQKLPFVYFVVVHGLLLGLIANQNLEHHKVGVRETVRQ